MKSKRVERGAIGVGVAWAASFMAKAFFPSAMPWWDLVSVFMELAPFFALVVAYGLIVAFLNWTASGGKASLVVLAVCGALFGPGGLALLQELPAGVPFLLLVVVIGAVPLYRRLTGVKSAVPPRDGR